MCAHPHPQGARGADGDLIILDEAAFIPPNFIQQVVVPMMQKKGVVVLGISTSGGPQNYYTQLMNMTTDTGAPLFRFITITRICKKCQEGPNPEKCTHNLHLMPPWKSMDRFRMCEKLLEGIANDMQREILGLMDRESGGAFSLDRLDELRSFQAMQRPPRPGGPLPTGDILKLPELVFISVDPGPGSSETAMVAACYANEWSRVVVRGSVPVCVPARDVATAPSAHSKPSPMSTLSRNDVTMPRSASSCAWRFMSGLSTSYSLRLRRASTMLATHTDWHCGMADPYVLGDVSPHPRSRNILGSLSRKNVLWPACRASPNTSTNAGSAWNITRM